MGTVGESQQPILVPFKISDYFQCDSILLQTSVHRPFARLLRLL